MKTLKLRIAQTDGWICYSTTDSVSAGNIESLTSSTIITDGSEFLSVIRFTSTNSEGMQEPGHDILRKFLTAANTLLCPRYSASILHPIKLNHGTDLTHETINEMTPTECRTYMYGHEFNLGRFDSFCIKFITTCEPFGLKPCKGDGEILYNGKHDAFDFLLGELGVILKFESRQHWPPADSDTRKRLVHMEKKVEIKKEPVVLDTGDERISQDPRMMSTPASEDLLANTVPPKDIDARNLRPTRLRPRSGKKENGPATATMKKKTLQSESEDDDT